MNNQKSKGKKRRLSDLEDSSGPDSSGKEEEVDSNSDEDSQADSASEDSGGSSDSESLGNSNIKSLKRSKAARSSALLSDSSESGDENSEKCAICLRSIVNQEVGNPEVCDHLFCSVCIIEWSKNSNVCPLDRQQFSIILVRANKDGNLVKKVPVEEPQAPRIENIELMPIDDTVCEICGSGDREDIMLLCDNCDRGFHTVCLTPPLENIPDENEWFCPNCEDSFRGPDGSTAIAASGLDDFLENVSTRFRTLRPRVQLVRTRLLERVRVTINRIVENYVLRHSDDPTDDEYLSDESDDSIFSLESSLDHVLSDQPSTSGTQMLNSLQQKTEAGINKRTKSIASPSKKSKKTIKKKRKVGTRRKKATSGKRKTTSTGRRKTSKRKVKVKTTRTKKVKVENPDGTITEKIIKTRTYKKRRQKRRKKKLKSVGSGRRGLRVKSITTPKTVKGRLALMLGMMPPKKPGQLLPEVKLKPNNSTSAIDLNRSRAGIPKLHIFGPRDELQCFSSDSDQEDIVVGGSGGVATIAQQRINMSRMRDRKKAALALQSMPPSSLPKPKTVIEPPSNECVDILGSILDSQAIWHSKDTNTNVKINSDGSIEVIKNKENSVVPKPENSRIIDVREGNSEASTQAPMYPGSNNRTGGFRPNRNSYGDSRNNQENMFTPRSGQGQSGVNFNRFGGPARNDREGYTNYLNNMPQGPTPFCRGGPPLRFRMPPRQQLRRIPFPPRNRPIEQAGEDERETKTDQDQKKEATDETEKEESKTQDDEDVDLYSDIETSTEKIENSGPEDAGSHYPALGPPPEPSAFLLGLDENGDFSAAENKHKSDAYDPAEPCDSEDEMVIDENQERASTPEKKESETESTTNVAEELSTKENISPLEDKCSPQKVSLEDDDDEDCPIFSIYSSTTREFSQKEEEERQKEIAEDKRKLEEMRSQGELKVSGIVPSNTLSDKNVLSDVKRNTEDENSEGSPDFDKNVRQNEGHAQHNSPLELETKKAEKVVNSFEKSRSPSVKSLKEDSRSRSNSIAKDKSERRSPSVESEKALKSKSPYSAQEKSSSPESDKYKRAKRKEQKFDSDSEQERERIERRRSGGDKDIDSETGNKNYENLERDEDSDNIGVSQKVATGLEGLDVEEVSSDNGDAFADKRSLSSLSLSDMSHQSKRSRSPIQVKKKKKNKKRKAGRSRGRKNYEDGELDDSERDNRLNDSITSPRASREDVENVNVSSKAGDKKRRRSGSTCSEKQVLGSKENKKTGKEKGKDGDLSWKKPSKKEKNYREGKKRSNDRGKSKSVERRKSKSPSPKKDKKKGKERKKKTEKKKEIERYDVRKIVKNKEIRKTDAFGRDLISKSRSVTRSRSRTPFRERSRNMLRRDSRSFSRSRSRSFRRGRSPVRRRYRTRSRSKSMRRSYSRSRSRSRSRRTKKKPKTKDRMKIRSRSRGRKSRSPSRGKRRSLTRSRSRSPVTRVVRSKKTRSRKSWSHHLSRSPSFSPRRSRSVSRSPIRVRRSSYSRSMSSSWSRGRSPLPTASSLEKLTVVLTTKDKKKWKKKKEGKKARKDERKRKKTGNSKEVFASGDNVLVSVNFRNNSNTTGNNSGGMMNVDSRNSHLNSMSPGPGAETSRKKKRASDYEGERVAKKSKKSNPISKKVVDVALSNACPKRAKKLTRLSEKDAEVILNRKPVAVIDLDMSPYREQTPSPVNVVVVSDSGSGDEGKEHTPQRPATRSSPNRELDKEQELSSNPVAKIAPPISCSPVENGYVVPASGPKTPPEPQIKFSINKPQQLKPIANPLGDDDDDDEEEIDEEEPEPRVESLDRRIEKELDPRPETLHKGPNTPPAPRGPSTPKEPSSPPTSPDAYDPFEPTKSRSPSPSQADKENRLSPKVDGKEDQVPGNVQSENSQVSVTNVDASEKTNEVVTVEATEDKTDSIEKSESAPAVDCSSNMVLPQPSVMPMTDHNLNESPEKKISVVISTQQNCPAIQKPFAPALKQVPMVSAATAVPPSSASVTPSTDVFSSLSPTKVSRTTTSTTQSVPVTGIQRLQHRLGSPVNRTSNAVKSTPEKRSTPRTDTNELFTSGNYMIRNVSKRNGEPTKQPRPLQDATNETIDSAMDMDDSPYSPASSEGDDLFDPPVEPSKPTQSNSKPTTTSYKGVVTRPPPGKSPVKQINKFDLLFGISGPTLSPLKVANKKPNAKVAVKPPTMPKVLPAKPQKKSTTKKNLMHKMDEDQLRILDDLPSSAVELQVKDKFLKKLNRQERVVDEVKTVLKPHYARKHITKEEYKDILRRSVPKICHSRSGEINPSKIQSLIEAYVRKFRHAKKKGMPIVAAKPKIKKTMFS